MSNLILVTGSEGLVGSRFLEISEHKKELNAPKQFEMDITSPSELKAIIGSFDFTAIVNFAAYTDVAGAEKERGDKEGDCWQINVDGVGNLVKAISDYKEKVHFIQISTDMVFSEDKSDKGPYEEDHPVEDDLAKLTWYGYTKGRAESVVKNTLGDNYTILRLIHPVRAQFEPKKDFLRKHLELYDQGKLYPLFDDQKISLTYIDEACKALDLIIQNKHFGTFHAASSETTTPYEIITYLLEKTRDAKAMTEKSSLKKFLKKAGDASYRYPMYGGLKVEKTQETLGIRFSSPKEIVDKLVLQGLK